MITRLLSVLSLAAVGAVALPALLTVSAKQVGGIYATGAADNDPAFQNYFVGYGTSAGGSRTPERRSFFWFDLPDVEGEVVSAKLTLKLIFGGLVFGKGPGDPESGPVPDDPFETFQLGMLPFEGAGAMIADPGLDAASAVAIFGAMADVAADPVTFIKDGPPPPEEIEIFLTPEAAAGLTGKLGSDTLLTGWMPTWSEDLRPKPGDPGKYFEGSELIFGFSDVHSGYGVPTLELEVVPEPGTMAALGLGLAAIARRRKRT